MKTKIKAWLHWNWDKGKPYYESDDDSMSGHSALVFFNEEDGEEYSAMPVEIYITKEGQAMQVENDLAKQKR